MTLRMHTGARFLATMFMWPRSTMLRPSPPAERNRLLFPRKLIPLDGAHSSVLVLAGTASHRTVLVALTALGPASGVGGHARLFFWFDAPVLERLVAGGYPELGLLRQVSGLEVSRC